MKYRRKQEPPFRLEKGEADDFGFPLLYKTPLCPRGSGMRAGLAPCGAPTGPARRLCGADTARLALEAASGGKNTLLCDDLGRPSVMVRIPRFNWADVLPGAPDEPCSAFIVGGRVLDCIYIGKYLSVVEYGRAYSLPGRDPATLFDYDAAREACAKKGPGWHMLTNAEWCAIANWCRAAGRRPRGNTAFGKSHSHPFERGVAAPDPVAAVWSAARTLTGTGPDSWSHDGTPFGIFDLVGNVWDMVSGIRTVDGEIQFIPDNDSALNIDESEHSPLWRAMYVSGAPAAPGSPGTLKYDGGLPSPGGEPAVTVPGGAVLSDSVINSHYKGYNKNGAHEFTFNAFAQMKASLDVPAAALELGVFPPGPDIGSDNFFIRNYGERTALRGGSWYDGATAGMFELYLRDDRRFIFPDVGFRCAYFDYSAQKTL